MKKIFITFVLILIITLSACDNKDGNLDLERSELKESEASTSFIKKVEKEEKLSADGLSSISEEDLSKINLVINEARETGVQCFAMPEGYFEYELTDEHLKKVLPAYDALGVENARVTYKSKDGVAEILQVEIYMDQNPNEARLIISPREIVLSEIYESDEEMSDVLGVPVLVKGLPEFEGSKKYIADFEKDGLYYNLRLDDRADDEISLARLLYSIISMDKADLTCLENPEIPLLRDEQLTLEEGYKEEDFGKYLISVPDRYVLNSCSRIIDQRWDYLSVSWSYDYDDVEENIHYINDEDRERFIEDIGEVERYDLNLYSIPWSDSVPDDFRATVENPIFRVEDLTKELIEKRMGEDGDIVFSVLYPKDVVVEIRAKGLEGEYLLDELKRIGE